MIIEAQVPAYSALLASYLHDADELQRETALLAAGDLGKSLLTTLGNTDDMLALHARAQARLAAQWCQATPGSDAARAHQRLAAGEGMPLMLALLLPQQMDERRRWQQLQEGLRQNDKLRAVATLAAGVAHDFNNLLGAITSLTELCQLQAPAGSGLARNLGGIAQASARAADLVGQLLSYAQERPLQRQPLALAAWLDGCQHLLAASLPRGLGLDLQLDADATVLADAGQLEQVVLNLVKNAGHAQQAVGGAVRLCLDRVASAQGPVLARLRVVNGGLLIPPDVLPRLFEPFFTTKAVGEGTGLGLSAALGIVQHHGGQLLASSALLAGAGRHAETVFTVLLPLADLAPGAP